MRDAESLRSQNMDGIVSSFRTLHFVMPGCNSLNTDSTRFSAQSDIFSAVVVCMFVAAQDQIRRQFDAGNIWVHHLLFVLLWFALYLAVSALIFNRKELEL